MANVTKVVNDLKGCFRIWDDGTIEKVGSKYFNDAIIDGTKEGSFDELEAKKVSEGKYVK